MKLFRQQEKNNEISSEFKTNVLNSIDLLLKADSSLSDKLVLNLFHKNGINKIDSTEILLFLPIAFARKLFHQINWHDTFIEFYGKDNQVEKKFSDSKPFQIIWEVTETYFNCLPVSPDIMNIVGRSAEFKALNDLLLQNPEAKVNDISVSKTVIVR